MDNNLKKALSPFKRRLAAEAAVRSAADSALAVLACALVLIAALRVLSRPLPAPGWMPAAWLALAALLYAARYRPTAQVIARRIDATGQMDAVSTAVAFQGSDSGLCRLQREETIRLLKRLPPKAVPIHMPVRRIAVCLLLLAAVCAAALVPVGQENPAETRDEAIRLVQARLDSLRTLVEEAELRPEDRAQLLDELDAMQAQLDQGQMDVTALAELSRRMDELVRSVGQLTPVDTYAEALLEYGLLRPIGEAIAAEDEAMLDEALAALESSLIAEEGMQQINALMAVVLEIGGSMKRPVRDSRQDVLAHAFAVLSGKLESAAAMVYNRQDNTKKIQGAFADLRASILDFFAGKDLERETAQEEDHTQRRLSHWAEKPGENEVDYGAVETVYDPPQGALEGYVPGALGADGRIQRIEAPPEGTMEGEVPYGSVYAAYYAAYLQEQDGIPEVLRETVAAYFTSLQ